MFFKFNDYNHNRCHCANHSANHSNCMNHYDHRQHIYGNCERCRGCRCCDLTQRREEESRRSNYRSQILSHSLSRSQHQSYHPSHHPSQSMRIRPSLYPPSYQSHVVSHNRELRPKITHSDYDYEKAIQMSKKEHDELEQYNANMNNDENDLSWIHQITKVLDTRHQLYNYLIKIIDRNDQNQDQQQEQQSDSFVIDTTDKMIINDDGYNSYNTPDTIDNNLAQYSKPHCDFIVGRGRVEPRDYMNLPLNTTFASRNVVFIDPNQSMHADVKQSIQDVDFKQFGISRDQDIYETIDVRIIFDWSSFYCGALQFLPNIVKKIGRRCQILVPLNKDENYIPDDIKQTLLDPFTKDDKFNHHCNIFTIQLVDGRYPLFDWDKISQKTLENIRSFIPSANSLADVVNPNKYIVISAFDEPDLL
jgi:hypothetical protein